MDNNQKNRMQILPQTQIDEMNKIMDFILNHPGVPVEDIRNRFHITSEEYNMIFDLVMPSIRKGNRSGYWKTKYDRLYRDISDRIQIETQHTTLTDDIWYILSDNRIGKGQNNMTEEEAG